MPQKHWIYEHILAKTYGWTLDYIRSLQYSDFMAHLVMCIAAEDAQEEFETKIHFPKV